MNIPRSLGTHWPGAVAWLALILGSVVILVCARGDLWFDEIWSFEWITRATSPGDVLTVFRHDNNHPVNTWWLMLLGEGRSMIAYRLLAVASGIVSLFLVGRLATILEPASHWIAVLLAVFSFPLVLYFSEARGYAPAVACSLATSVILLENRSRPSWAMAALFWLVCAIGMLSHATFLLALAALGIWKVARIAGASQGLFDAMITCSLWFVVPGLAACVYYFGFLHSLEIGGGPEYSLRQVIGHFFSYALGFPASGRGAFWSTLGAGVLYVCALAWGWRGNPHGARWLFALLPLPTAFVLWVTRPEILYFRYFLVLLPFFYLAVAAVLSRMLASRGWGPRIAAMVFLGLYLSAQTPRLIALGTTGRGGYRNALTLIAASPFANKRGISDQDSRNGLLVAFFRKREARLAGLRFIPFAQASPGESGWLIRHTQEPLPKKPVKLIEIEAGKFRLVAVFPYTGVSGWHWLIYRAEPTWQPPKTSVTKLSHDRLLSPD